MYICKDEVVKSPQDFFLSSRLLCTQSMLSKLAICVLLFMEVVFCERVGVIKLHCRVNREAQGFKIHL